MSRPPYILLLLLLLAFAGCDQPAGPSAMLAEQGVAVANSPAPTPTPTSEPVSPDPVACEESATGLIVCPNPEAMADWARGAHVAEPAEDSLRAALDPSDPVEIRDGLVIYDELLASVARQTRTHLELWANTPRLSDAQLAEFTADPELWSAVVAFRAGSTQAQLGALRKALRSRERQLLRAMLLRDGVFYVEDPAVAAYAAKYVALHHLFDVDDLELQRGGLVYQLRRGTRGVYQHFDPVLDETRGTFHMFDRVGPSGTLQPILGYELQELRREHGLSNVVVGAETDAGRSATVRFFDGRQLDGALVLDAKRQRQLAVVAEPSELETVRAENVRDRATICNLLEVTEVMVREGLKFDEPTVEIGQQDGVMRWRFEKAYAAGKTTYRINGVTYPVFDRKGRPMVPQLCIDFVTDAVQRLHGTWWSARDDEGGFKEKPGTFDIREYMPFRTVRSLLSLGRATPTVASVDSLADEELIPYARREEFFENLWRRRDTVREGDIVVIYGLRADRRNHFHSFYVRETDPVYGVPVVLTANPGFARIQAWHDVMWESPKRSIRHIVRWNPDWLRSPPGVGLANNVIERAEEVVSKSTDPGQ